MIRGYHRSRESKKPERPALRRPSQRPGLGHKKGRSPSLYRNAVTYRSPAAVFFVNEFLAVMEVPPGRVVFEHGVENDQEFSHAGGNDRLWLFALGGQPLAEGSDRWIAASG
jgi:hypothetical protein